LVSDEIEEFEKTNVEVRNS